MRVLLRRGVLARPTITETYAFNGDAPALQTTGSFGSGAYLRFDQDTDERFEALWLRGPGSGRGWADLGAGDEINPIIRNLSFTIDFRVTSAYSGDFGPGHPGIGISVTELSGTGAVLHNLPKTLGINIEADSDFGGRVARGVAVNGAGTTFATSRLSYTVGVTYTSTVRFNSLGEVEFEHDGSTVTAGPVTGDFTGDWRYLVFPPNKGSDDYDVSESKIEGWADNFTIKNRGN